MLKTKPCDCCRIAMQDQKEPSGFLPDYNFECIYCGARYVQHIDHMKIANNEKFKLTNEAVARWVKRGHDAIEIRMLASDKNVPHQPQGKKP